MRPIHIAAFGVVACAVATPVYGDFTFTYGGHTYELITTPRTWTAAAADAASRSIGGASGALARMDGQAENDTVFAQLLAQVPPSSFSKTTAPDGGGGAYVWLGGTDRKSDGTWLWDGDNTGAGDQFWSGKNTGAPVGGLYSNWGKTAGRQNEPDNFGGTQDALGLSLNGWPLGVRGEWNDLNETNRLYALVEIPAVPEPAAAIGIVGVGAFAFVRRRDHRRG